MEAFKSIWPPKGRVAVLAWFGVGAVVLIGAAAAFAWPALTRPEPPLEAQADRDGVRISLVQPPKAASSTSPGGAKLDVGLSDAAQAMVQGREPLNPPARPRVDTPRLALAEPRPPATTPLLVEDDTPPPPEFDDRWAEDDRYEAARQWRWEAERRAREERAERRAWRRAERERLDALDRWEDPRARPEDRQPPAPREEW